jgi:hypothetical protein
MKSMVIMIINVIAAQLNYTQRRPSPRIIAGFPGTYSILTPGCRATGSAGGRGQRRSSPEEVEAGLMEVEDGGSLGSTEGEEIDACSGAVEIHQCSGRRKTRQGRS